MRSGTSLGSVRFDARGGANTSANWSHDSGAAGTVYMETANEADGRGRLLIANDNRDMLGQTNTLTLLPAPSGALTNELRNVTLTISNRSYVALTTNLLVGNLYLLTNTPNYLLLRGYTLRVRARYHDDWGTTNTVTYDGGQIIWGAGQTGALMWVR